MLVVTPSGLVKSTAQQSGDRANG